jgi:hypothetical protein
MALGGVRSAFFYIFFLASGWWQRESLYIFMGDFFCVWAEQGSGIF